jgi:hypothetical protein
MQVIAIESRYGLRQPLPEPAESTPQLQEQS